MRGSGKAGEEEWNGRGDGAEGLRKRNGMEGEWGVGRGRERNGKGGGAERLRKGRGS